MSYPSHPPTTGSLASSRSMISSRNLSSASSSGRMSLSVSTRSMARLASSTSENAPAPHTSRNVPPHLASSRLAGFAAAGVKSRITVDEEGVPIKDALKPNATGGAERISAGTRAAKAKRQPLTVLANRSSNGSSSLAPSSNRLSSLPSGASSFSLAGPKRKTETEGERPRKMVRRDDRPAHDNEPARFAPIPRAPAAIPPPAEHQPTTPTRMAPPGSRIPVRTPFITPTRPTAPAFANPAPTPARDILRRKADDDEDMDEDDEDDIVARPPTPPRLHDRTPYRAFVHKIEAVEDRVHVKKEEHRVQLASTTPTDEPPITTATSALVSPSPALRQTTLSFSRVPAVSTPPRSLGEHAMTTTQGGTAASVSPSRSGGIFRTGGSPSSPSRRAIGSPSFKSPSRGIPSVLSTTPTKVRSTTPTDDLPASGGANSMEVDMVHRPQAAPRAALGMTSSAASSSMPPPSRIPTFRSRRNLTVASDSSETNPPSSSVASIRQPGGPVSSLPTRRPVSRPVMTSSNANSRPTAPLAPSSRPPAANDPASGSATVPTKRKPSYPSSLSLGPTPGLSQPRQTQRMVTSPVPAHMLEPHHSSSMDLDQLGPAARQSPRSVSEPAPRPRTSLNMSYRREGWGDTSRNLVGLEAALERLKMRKDKRPSLETAPLAEVEPNAPDANLARSADPEQQDEIPAAPAPSVSLSSSSRLSSVHKSRYSLASALGHDADAGGAGDMSMAVDEHPGDRSIAALMCSNSGGGCLKGVVAFVDVWTSDGTDSGRVFADLLRSLGARVLSRPTENCTHIVYKSGRPNTLSWWRKQEDPPHIVGISWVTKSKEAGKRLEEGPYRVEVAEEDIFQKRRKSMEPKAMSLASSSSVRSGLLSVSISEAKRKSLLYAPKVGSPLKKGYRRYDEDG